MPKINPHICSGSLLDTPENKWHFPLNFQTKEIGKPKPLLF